MRRRLPIFLISPFLLLGCTKNTSGPKTGTAEFPLSDKGRQVYLSNCTACHNADPKVDGALGPAVAGASLALLEARILRAEYPPGYQPKRHTRTMTALPFLKNELEALHAFLNAQ